MKTASLCGADGSFVLSVQNGECRRGESDIVHSSFVLMTGLSDRNILKCTLNCVCSVGVFQAVDLDVSLSQRIG